MASAPARSTWSIWIESIPFRETRDYVQRIMEGVTVYRDRLNGQVRTVPPALGRS